MIYIVLRLRYMKENNYELNSFIFFIFFLFFIFYIQDRISTLA